MLLQYFTVRDNGQSKSRNCAGCRHLSFHVTSYSLADGPMSVPDLCRMLVACLLLDENVLQYMVIRELADTYSYTAFTALLIWL